MISAIGIVGAGKLGMALARAAVDAGLEARITSRDLANTELIVEVMAPGARVVSLEEVAASDIVVLALPLHRLKDLPPALFEGRVVVDAVNFWHPVDGDRWAHEPARTSHVVRDHLPKARLVKGLNQLGYHDVDDGRRPAGAPDRLGVALAGTEEDKAVAAELVERLGFDPVDAGSLEDGDRLGPGGPAFGVAMTARELRKALWAPAESGS